MATEAELRYIVTAQDRELKALRKELAATGKTAGTDVPAGAAKAGKSLDKLNKVVNVVGAALVAGVVIGAKKAVDAASALEEQTNKTNVVFGKSAGTIQKWAQGTASSLGISNRAALEFTGTFGNMLVPMGFARKEAAGVSKQLVTLGADLASFNNATPEETLDALRAGLAGETEPLRKFGVFLNEARIQAEALSLGLVKTSKNTDDIRSAQLRAEVAQRNYSAAVREHGANSKEALSAEASLISANKALKSATEGTIKPLTAEQKAKATLSIITKDTADAQGDFGETSDSAANSQRIAAATAEDAAAAFGEQLLPVYTSALQLGTRLLKWTGDHTTETKILIGTILALVAGVKLFIVTSKAYSAATTAGTLANKALNAVLRVQRVLLATSIIGALILVGVALFALWKKSETFRNIVKGALEVVKTAFEKLKDAAQVVRDKVSDFWDAIGDKVITVVSFILKVFDKWLGGYSMIIRATGKLADKFLPGSPFADAADAIDGAREKVRGLDSAMQGLRPKSTKVKVGIIISPEGTTRAVRRTGDIAAADVSAASMFHDSLEAGIVERINSNPSLFMANLGGLFGSPVPDLSPALWGEAGLARQMGLTITSTYRPGATVAGSGARSDHSYFPAKAFDAAGSGPSMIAFARSVAGLPGVDTVIHSALGRGRGLWKAGIGWTGISSPTTYRDHFSHVHVDTFDTGGWLAPHSVTLAVNRTAMWEPVGPPGAGGGDTMIVFNFPNYVGNKRDLANAVRGEFEKFARRNGRSIA